MGVICRAASRPCGLCGVISATHVGLNGDPTLFREFCDQFTREMKRLGMEGRCGRCDRTRPLHRKRNDRGGGVPSMAREQDRPDARDRPLMSDLAGCRFARHTSGGAALQPKRLNRRQTSLARPIGFPGSTADVAEIAQYVKVGCGGRI
jgi:hypothetical protein